MIIVESVSATSQTRLIKPESSIKKGHKNKFVPFTKKSMCVYSYHITIIYSGCMQRSTAAKIT